MPVFIHRYQALRYTATAGIANNAMRKTRRNPHRFITADHVR